jgi:hypothetical protein
VANFLVLPSYAIVAFLLWRALAVAQLFCRRRFGLDDHTSTCLGVIAIGCVGYMALFAYLWSTAVGLLFSGAFISFLLGEACWRRGTATERRSASNDRLFPFVIAALFGVIYLACSLLYADEVGANRPADLFFEKPRPHDYRIPLMYAQAIYHRLPSRTGIDQWGWYYTDRPPLQTGFVLLFSPLWKIVRPDLVYQAVGTLLQSSSLAAAWLLCRSLGFRRREILLAALALGGSGFLYYNSIYIWPKLLAAMFFLLALLPIGGGLLERRRLTYAECVIVAGATALALLSHGGVAFGLLALAILLVAFLNRFFSIRTLALSIFVAAMLYAPWSLYTHFVDPNNARLLKLHLTSGDDAASEPFIAMLIRSYRQTTFDEWLTARLENLRALDHSPIVSSTARQSAAGLWDARRRVPLEQHDYAAIDPGRLSYDLISLGTVLRIDQREHVLRALGPLCLAWPLLILLLWPGWRARILDPGLTALLLLNLLTLILWVTFEFRPGDAVITHSSYAMVLIGMISAVIILARISWFLGLSVVGLHIAIGFVIWVVLAPGPFMPPSGRISRTAVIVAILAGAAAAYLLRLWYREPSRPSAWAEGRLTTASRRAAEKRG